MKTLRALLSALALLALLAIPALASHGSNCEDYDSQAAAQAHLEMDPSDPDGLDGPVGPTGAGITGVACEDFGYINSARDETPVQPVTAVPPTEQETEQEEVTDDQQGETPNGMPKTGAGGMATPSLPIGQLAGALSLAACYGYFLLRRRG